MVAFLDADSQGASDIESRSCREQRKERSGQVTRRSGDRPRDGSATRRAYLAPQTKERRVRVNEATRGYGLGGWVRVFFEECHPSYFLHPFATGSRACSAFAGIDLRAKACWKDKESLKRGQLLASTSFLATRWNWSPSRVDRFLNELIEKELIQRDTQGGRKPSIITICNYGLYNGPLEAVESASDGTSDGQVNNEATTEPIKYIHQTDQVFATAEIVGEELEDHTDQLVIDSPFFTLDTVAGLVRRFNGGGEPCDGLAGELHLYKEAGLSPKEAIYILVSLAERVREECEGEVSFSFLTETGCDWQPFVEHGQELLDGVYTSSDLHDRLDELFPWSADYRPEVASGR